MPEGTEFAERQLDRIQAFFPRVDAKMTWVFAIQSGMLAVIAARFDAEAIRSWQVALSAGLAIGFIGAGLLHTYKCSFPDVKGGGKSLIYFNDIAKHDVTEFQALFSGMTTCTAVDDLLEQVWSNSIILGKKFRSLRISFGWTIASLIPWCWYIAATALGGTNG